MGSASFFFLHLHVSECFVQEDETRAAGINLAEQRRLTAGCDDRRYRLMEQEITEGFDHTQRLRRNAQILADGKWLDHTNIAYYTVSRL